MHNNFEFYPCCFYITSSLLFLVEQCSIVWSGYTCVYPPSMGIWVISTCVGSVNGAGKNIHVRVVEHLLSAAGAIPQSGNAGSHANSV